MLGSWFAVDNSVADINEIIGVDGILVDAGYNEYYWEISEDAGNFLCNNLYYNGLKYIKEKNINCKMIFIHIPKIENISNIDLLANIF